MAAAEKSKNIRIKFERRDGAGKTGKEYCGKLRARGGVPAVFYGPEYKEGIPGQVDAKEIAPLMNTVRWETTLIDLEMPDGKTEMVLIRELQRHAITRKALHVDFYQLLKGHTVRVEVPVVLLDREFAPGVKQGGVIEQVLHTVEMEVESTEIPEELVLDVSKMEIGDEFLVKDLKLPASAVCAVPLDSPVVVIHYSQLDTTPETGEGDEKTEVEVVAKGKAKSDED